MAKYIKQELPDLQRTGEKKAYYRLKTTRKIGFQEFIDYVCNHDSGIGRGEVLRVLIRATDAMAELLAEGYSVSIDELGLFKATIGLEADKEMDDLDGKAPKRNARSLCLNGVNFSPDKRLIIKASRRCQLKRAGVNRVHRSPFSKEERLQMALDYLDKFGVIRVKDYMELVDLSHTTAAEELRALNRWVTASLSCGRR